MILGTPFFRTAIVSFDYYNNTIEIVSKNPNSPIVPTDAAAITTKSGLSTGAIVGISIGSIALALIIFLAIFFSCCHKKSKKELNYEAIDASNTIQGGEDDEGIWENHYFKWWSETS